MLFRQNLCSSLSAAIQKVDTMYCCQTVKNCYLVVGKNTKTVPTAPIATDMIRRTILMILVGIDIVSRCNDRLAASGPIAQIIKTEKAPKRPITLSKSGRKIAIANRDTEVTSLMICLVYALDLGLMSARGWLIADNAAEIVD